VTVTTVPADFAQLDLAETSEQLSAFFDDPSRFPDAFALFRRLRELEPVHWSGHKSWVITGYPEGKEILFSAQIGRQASAEAQFGRLSDPAVDPPEAVHAVEILLASLINRDPPDHTRLRQLVSRTFSPRAVNGWQPRIDELVAAVTLHELGLNFVLDEVQPR
jgi:cytochrome P450